MSTTAPHATKHTKGKKPAPSAPKAPQAPAGAPQAPLAGGKVVGDVVHLPLAAVQPNGWNPNRMSAETRASLQHGLQNDGWLASQALLVWATDDDGQNQMLIIDGEHRWTVARDLGFTHGPMVLLKGISEAKAKSLTVAMNQRRGAFDDAALQALLRDIEVDIPDLALDTGLSNDQLAKLLAAPAEEVDLPGTPPQPNLAPPSTATGGAGGAGSGAGQGPSQIAGSGDAYVRVVQVYASTAEYDAIHAAVKALAPRLGTQNLTDTLVAALRRVCTAEGLPDPMTAAAPADTTATEEG